jgi:hypothetical protein
MNITSDLKEILRQLKYDGQQLDHYAIAIENATNKKDHFKGKPIYNGYCESIERWTKLYLEHKKTFLQYSIKLKNHYEN